MRGAGQNIAHASSGLKRKKPLRRLGQQTLRAVPGGWETGSRTPIERFRAACPTIERSPNRQARDATRRGTRGSRLSFPILPPRNVAQSSRDITDMLPEVFECPQCQRQFVVELVESAADQSIHCPQCKRYLGEKDLNFVIITEIEELAERLRFERDRLERDEAVYSMTDCDAELRTYGVEVYKVVSILRKTLADLESLKQSYR
jgi:hypothetical protein